jgi:hypothetical protein
MASSFCAKYMLEGSLRGSRARREIKARLGIGFSRQWFIFLAVGRGKQEYASAFYLTRLHFLKFTWRLCGDGSRIRDGAPCDAPYLHDYLRPGHAMKLLRLQALQGSILKRSIYLNGRGVGAHRSKGQMLTHVHGYMILQIRISVKASENAQANLRIRVASCAFL